MPTCAVGLSWLSSLLCASSALWMVACGGAPPPPSQSKPPAPALGALPGAHESWFVDAAFDARVHVLQLGRGTPGSTPLVLVHGLGTAGMRDFVPLMPGLAADRQVLALDLPGFAGSGPGRPPYDPARYADLVARVVARYLGSASGGADAGVSGPLVDLLGHSMGGAIALQFAARHAGMLRRLVLVDVAGVLHKEAFVASQIRGRGDAVAAARDVPGLGDGMRETADGLATSLLGQVRRLEPAPWVLELSADLTGAGPGTLAALALIDTNFAPAIEAVRAPTLILWGEQDTTAPLRTARLLEERLPHARLVVFPGVGHVPMASVAPEMLTLITAHLASDAPAVGPGTPPQGDGAAPAGPAGLPRSKGAGRCHGQAGQRFTGRYDSITLEDCARVQILDAQVGRLVVRESSVRVVRAQITAGVEAIDSNVTMTGVDIGPRPGGSALDLETSLLDLAGVTLRGYARALGRGGSTLLFSACRIEDERGVRYLHGKHGLVPGDRL